MDSERAGQDSAPITALISAVAPFEGLFQAGFLVALLPLLLPPPFSVFSGGVSAAARALSTVGQVIEPATTTSVEAAPEGEESEEEEFAFASLATTLDKDGECREIPFTATAAVMEEEEEEEEMI